MSRSVIETVLGGFVLLGAVIFLVFSYSKGDAGAVTGYLVSANFAKIGGLKEGDNVQISGVKIGQVVKVELDPVTYLARVTMEIDNAIKIPDDSAATISSLSLLGGMAMNIEPGGSETMLVNGGEIQYSQAPQNLEELLGKFIFSVQGSDKKGDEAAPATQSSTPNVTETPSVNTLEIPESP